VENVSWNDCQDFLKKLSIKTGKDYRLPSEAEWEYACRAGSSTKYCFGNDESQLKEYAWYGNNSGETYLDALQIWQTDSNNYYSILTKNKCQTHPVGEKKPNQFGLYDMHGNLWEWCEDNWQDNYSQPRTQKPYKDTTDNYHILRGGSWIGGPESCRSAYRLWFAVGNNYFGFRLVLSASVSNPLTL
jgi:formylglycine-generating enzyme required for sulfatase activity